MTDEIEIINCSDDDVVSFDDEICKLSKFRNQFLISFHEYSNSVMDSLRTKLGNLHDLKIEQGYKKWFNTGKECKILKEGQRWQKGKIKIKLTIEFIPDEPEPEEMKQNTNNSNESPLDEIRQQITH